MNLPEFSVNKRVTISMLIMIVVLGGIVAFFGLGLDLMPELEFPMITVVTKYEGVAPEDIENLITRPVEEVCSTLKNVKNITSSSEEGTSSVMVEFEWGINIDFAAQDARESLDRLKMVLPEDADDPMVMKFDPSQMPILVYGISGMENTMELKDYIEDNVTPRLERIEGVAMAMALGGLEREINVLVDRTKLEAYTLSLDEIIGKLQTENQNISAGQVTKDYTEYLIRLLGEYKDLDEIRNTVLKKVNDVPIYIKDVAEVKDTHIEKRHYTRLNGKDTVIMMVAKQSGANTVIVINEVEKALEEMKGKMPWDIKFHAVMDQGDIIKKIASETAKTAVMGGILAVLLIFIFLRDWRSTLCISLAIPISIITSFIGLYVFGYTLNILTLGGFSLVVGMLVDNAIVVIENIFRHLEEGKTRKEAAKIGATEVVGAITGSTLTTICVFLPMVLGGGMAGEMSKPLAVTVIIGLVASLFVALTIIPMIASIIFKQRTKEEYVKAYEGKRFERLKEWYKQKLSIALFHKKQVILAAFGGFLLSVLILYLIGFEFMPKGDNPMMIMNAKMPVGTNLEETDRVIKQIEDDFIKLPEKKFVVSTIGPSAGGVARSAQGMGAADVNEGMVMARLVDLEDRKRGSEEITEELRKKLPKLEDAKFEFRDMFGMMMSGSGSPVEIKIFGKDLNQLKSYANTVALKIKDVKGVRDIDVSMREGKPELQIRIDRDKASHFGLTVGQIGQTLQISSLGKVATRYRVGGDETDVRVRFKEFDRDSIKDIENITIPTRKGFHVTFPDIASLDYGVGPLRIMRENRVRKVTVTANTTDRAIGKITNDIKKELRDFNLPSGYFMEHGGSYEQMEETLTTLFLAFLAAVILIYMIMAAQFESFTQPLVILFTVPLSIIGVALGLAAFGMSLSSVAFMGMIILAGVVVNNGIVMIDYVNQLRAKGVDKYEALVQSATTRLRPILITSLSTIIGVIPMALSRSQGWEMRAPIGIAVGSGLLVATILTLFVVPVLYATVDRIARESTKKMVKQLHGDE
ncbi:MAG: Swarming motility protein SwrC [Elusimicrobia bacterium ADurb.Bin231]|nr:MAG: Swarming motility protein SwrC [Elusimicrobia bacterium ADurb.Bin231]